MLATKFVLEDPVTRAALTQSKAEAAEFVVPFDVVALPGRQRQAVDFFDVSLIVRPFGNLGRQWEDEIYPATLSSA